MSNPHLDHWRIVRRSAIALLRLAEVNLSMHSSLRPDIGRKPVNVTQNRVTVNESTGNSDIPGKQG